MDKGGHFSIINLHRIPVALAPPASNNADPDERSAGVSGRLFDLLNELVITLLGALLGLLAFSGRYSTPHRESMWIALGVFLIYWGARAWIRRAPKTPPWHARLRGGSLALVGATMLLMNWLPLEYSGLFLGVVGALLVIRGIGGAALLLLTP
jgi:hypothetical protein